MISQMRENSHFKIISKSQLSRFQTLASEQRRGWFLNREENRHEPQ